MPDIGEGVYSCLFVCARTCVCVHVYVHVFACMCMCLCVCVSVCEWCMCVERYTVLLFLYVIVFCVYMLVPSSNHGERDCKWLPNGGCCHNTRYLVCVCGCVCICVFVC